MQRDLGAFAQAFDVVIVGAGIHGACIARLASSSGLRVALIDKGDFGGATSRNCAKLLHGGLRYVQHFDVPRVRESMHAQRAFFRFAPHLVRPLRCVIPAYGHGTRGPTALAAGFAAFHVLAGGRNRGIRPEIRLPWSGVLSRRRLLGMHPFLGNGNVTGGAYWYDGQMLDASRLVLECVWDAVGAGAVAANHVECVGLLHNAGGVHGVIAQDGISGRQFDIRAPLTVNATGPWIDRLLDRGPPASKGRRTTVWTRNINLVTRPLYEGDDAVGVASDRASDAAIGKSRRLFFLSPWHGCSVVGTSHDVFEHAPDALQASGEVISGFIDEINHAAPELRLTLDDVRSVHVGLTPAEEGESDRAKRSFVLDHELLDGIPGLVSVAGIKYTTAPVVADGVVALARHKLRKSGSPTRFEQPAAGVPGQLEAGTVIGDAESSWAARIYGARADSCLGVLPPPHPGDDLVFRCRVRFGIEHEMVVRLTDAVLRATDWAERGLLTQAQLNWCAQTLQTTYGWSAERLAEERAGMRASFQHLRISPVSGGRAAVGRAGPEPAVPFLLSENER